MPETTPTTTPVPKLNPDQVQLPTWLWVMIALSGSGISGLVLPQVTNSVTEDITRLETKVEELDSKIDDLTFMIIRAHPEIDRPR